MTIKILIADDHPLIAEGIKNTFANHSEYEVVCVANNGKEVLDFVKSNSVDIALLDINMPEMDGIQCAKILIKDFPTIKVAILSMHQEASLIRELIEVGVKGYMLKTTPSDELLIAVKSIYKGKEYFTSDVTKAILKNENTSSVFTPLSQKSELVDLLTSRELEIIKYVTQGMTNSQIGEELYISPRTVDTHRTNIMKKIDVKNVASLIRFAFQNGLT